MKLTVKLKKSLKFIIKILNISETARTFNKPNNAYLIK
jgi:hypothetical protein